MVKLWDVNSGQCRKTLTPYVVNFSHTNQASFYDRYLLLETRQGLFDWLELIDLDTGCLIWRWSIETESSNKVIMMKLTAEMAIVGMFVMEEEKHVAKLKMWRLRELINSKENKPQNCQFLEMLNPKMCLP